MRQFSAHDLNRRFGDITHAASQEPVTITQHRKPRFVLMTVERYEALKALGHDSRRVHTAAETPDDVAEWLVPALDRFASGETVSDD